MNENASDKPVEEPVAANANDPAAELEKPQTLEEALLAKEEEVARLKDMYLRAVAETENVRTRAKRENEDTAKYAVTRFARDIVSLLDTLERASTSVSAEARKNNEMIRQVGEGLDMTLQEVQSIFERNGIKRISPVGEKFDHNFHQAVAQTESADHPPGTVLQVLQAGYVLHDRLLKPAMVTVSAATANKPAGDAA